MGYRNLALLLAIAAVVAAGIGASSAGAAVLCTTNANCTTSHNGAGGQMYDKGDSITATAAGVQFTTSAGDVTCKKAEIVFKLTGTGGVGLVVPGEITWAFSGCVFAPKVGAPVNCFDTHQLNYPGNITLGTAPNGTFTFAELFVFLNCGGVLSCSLGTKDLKLNVTGGNPATISVSKLALDMKAGSACPETAELDASYQTATPVYVYGG